MAESVKADYLKTGVLTVGAGLGGAFTGFLIGTTLSGLVTPKAMNVNVARLDLISMLANLEPSNGAITASESLELAKLNTFVDDIITPKSKTVARLTTKNLGEYLNVILDAKFNKDLGKFFATETYIDKIFDLAEKMKNSSLQKLHTKIIKGSAAVTAIGAILTTLYYTFKK